MIESSEWLQLVKDVVVPVSSTLTGAIVAYIVAKKGSDSQRRLLEQERELAVLARIYHLLQEYERYGTHCRDTYDAYCRDKTKTADRLRYDTLSSDMIFDIRELERLIELNFRCFREELSNNKVILTKLLMVISAGDRGVADDVKNQHSKLHLGIRSMMNSIAERSAAVRGE